MAGIVGQSDYYGLPEQSRPEPPSQEKMADILRKPTPWSGPGKLVEAGEHWDKAKGLGHEIGVAAGDIGSAIGEVGSAAAWGLRHPIKTIRGESDLTPEADELRRPELRKGR
jgi:hypothetical protein